MVDYKPIMFGIVVTLIFGLISVFASFFGIVIQIILGTIAVVMGGLAAAYTTDGDNKDGGVNGSISGIIGGAILGTLLLGYTSNEFSIPGALTGMFVGGILFGFNFGIIGAVIGNVIKNDSLEKPKFTGYLICNNCGDYYGLFEGENPEDFTNECECGGKLEYKKSLRIKMNWRMFGLGVILSLAGGILLICTFWFLLGTWPIRTALTSLLVGIIIIWSSYLKSRGIDW